MAQIFSPCEHRFFVYDKKWFTCDKPVAETTLPGGTGWTSKCYEYRTGDGLLGVRVTWKFYTDYPAAEYLPELYAVGTNTTKIVEKYASFDFRRTYAGTNPREDTATRIRALVGDRCCNFPFVPETHWLGEETTIGFSAVSRSSDGTFYFPALDRSKNWVEPLHDMLWTGDPLGCNTAVDTLSRLIDESNIDVYRQDCNMRCFVKFWEQNDAPDRCGVTEMKYIAGLYTFWDRLRAKYPNLLIDNCASGGRRLDIELNSRSHCYCRSDFFINYRGEDQILSAQNTTLNTLDIQPFQGSESTPGKFGDEYGFFSATGPGLVLTPGLRGYYSAEGITSEHLAWLQKLLPVCDRMRTFFQGDFYPQTEPTGLDRDVWCAYQMHRADLDAGFVMAFRRQEAPNDRLAVDLGGLDPNATYAFENWDGTGLGTVRGDALRVRPVIVAKKRDFALFFYRKVAAK